MKEQFPQPMSYAPKQNWDAQHPILCNVNKVRNCNRRQLQLQIYLVRKFDYLLEPRQKLATEIMQRQEVEPENINRNVTALSSVLGIAEMFGINRTAPHKERKPRVIQTKYKTSDRAVDVERSRQAAGVDAGIAGHWR